jgi:hypothetical protein
VVAGTLHRSGAGQTAGVAWLDQPGDDHVLVRRSRAVGLPAPVPDVFGLAVRVPTDHDGQGPYGDLLFATTGLGRVTRYTLTATRSPYGRPMTTLLPYRTPAGPVLLSAVFDDERTVALSWAIGSGDWHRFADLLLDEEPVDDPDPRLSFDPVRHQLPGLGVYGWVRRLREPAYRTARRSRHT